MQVVADSSARNVPPLLLQAGSFGSGSLLGLRSYGPGDPGVIETPQAYPAETNPPPRPNQDTCPRFHHPS
jgi:hypothetical protein